MNIKIPTDKELAKKFPNAGIASKIYVDSPDELWLPSKCLTVNYMTGGGIKFGKIMELFGSESSGKSLLAQDFSSVAQSLGGIVLWNDAEQSFDKKWAKANGIDPDRIVVSSETAIENVSDWVMEAGTFYRSKLTHNEPILFVCDSIAALDCEANINAEQANAKAEMGNRAKALYKFLRIRNEAMNMLGITSIFINQLRKKVGATQYEDPDITVGGDAMKYYAHIRMGAFALKRLKDDVNGFEDNVGNLVSVRIKKNKLAPPRPTQKVKVFYNLDYSDVGFDKYFGLAEVFERTQAVTRKKGSSFYKLDGKSIAQGEDQFNEAIQDDDDLRAELIKRAKINTVSKTRARLEKLKSHDINNFPVVEVKSKSAPKKKSNESEE